MYMEPGMKNASVVITGIYIYRRNRCHGNRALYIRSRRTYYIALFYITAFVPKLPNMTNKYC